MKSDLLDILLAQFRKNICSVSAEKLVGEMIRMFSGLRLPLGPS